MVLIKFDPILNALREKDAGGGGATDLSGLAGSYAVSGNYVNKGGDTMTGSLTLSMNDPEVRLIDLGDSEYTRWTRTDTNKEMFLYNRVNKPGGDPVAHNVNSANNLAPLSLTSTAKSYSFSVWAKSSSVTTADYFFDTETGRFIVAFGNNTGPMGFYNDTDGWNSFAVNLDTTNTWVHYVFVFDASGNTAKLYKNGAQTGDTKTFNAEVNIGGTVRFFSGFGGSSHIQGTIDEVNVWERAITEAEITTLYNAGSGIRGDITTSPWNSGFLVGYHLDENTGTSVTDFSGNGHTGTLSSAAWVAGKVATATTITETQIISSKNGVSGTEEGINTFGDSAGRSIIDGNDIRFNIVNVEKASFDSTGKLVLGNHLYNSGNSLNLGSIVCSGLAVNTNTLYVSGNRVGIGNTAPEFRLTVSDDVTDTTSISNNGQLFLRTTSATENNHAGILFGTNYGSADTLPKAGIKSQHTSIGADIVFLTSSNYAAGLTKENMRLKSDGSVGIGIGSPTEKLHISGNMILTGSITISGNFLNLGSLNFNTSGIAPGSQIIILPTNVYGSGTINDLLGDPRVWLNVTINGGNYKIPAF